MYIPIIDYWRSESAYGFVTSYVTDEEFLKAFPELTREGFLDNPEVLWDEELSDWEIIYEIIQHWDGYYTIFSDDNEHIVMQLKIPDSLDPNNIAHYRRN